MAQISSSGGPGHVWGVRAAATARVASRIAKQSRWYRATAAATDAIFRSLHRVLGVLWLEVAGLVFVFFAVVGSTYAWREYHKHNAASLRVAAGVCFSVLFAWYGMTSFWRTRRK